jgi:cell division protein FtsX
MVFLANAAVSSSLQNATLTFCLIAWVLCSILFAVAAYLVLRDIETLKAQMRERAEIERAAQSA